MDILKQKSGCFTLNLFSRTQCFVPSALFSEITNVWIYNIQGIPLKSTLVVAKRRIL